MNNSWGFDLTQFDDVWKIILQIALLLGFLLIGNILRRTIPFLRKAFIPSALIGGLLLFLVNILFSLGKIELVDKRTMQIITYHALAIGFIASSLKIFEDKNKKAPIFESIQNGAITGGTYMLQAVMEGICFGIRDSYEVARALGIDVRRTRICGGGAKGDLAKKMMADILNIDVDVPANDQGPSMGGAILAAVAAGEYASVEEAAAKIVKMEGTISPDPDKAKKYEEKYQRYRQLYPILKDWY